MSVIKLNKGNFETEVASGKVLIDFYADWCGPCKMMAGIVDKIAEEDNGIKVCQVNVDEEGELAQQFRVMSIPMFVAMENGQTLKKTVGACNKSDLEALFA